MTDVFEDGRLLAYLDGELSASERASVERLLGEDPEARARLEHVRRRARTVELALAGEAVPIPDRGRIRHAVRRQVGEVGRSPEPDLDETGPDRGRGWTTRRRLAQAAVLVLLFAAGASAAVPGTPVHAWLQELLPTDPVETGIRSEGVAAEPPEGSAGSRQVGVRVSPAEGRLVVVLTGRDADSEIEVRLVDGPRGGVFASQGTEFSSGAGRIDAELADGPVRVEIPSAATEATVRVDGVVYLEKRGAAVELPGPGAETDGDGFLFHGGSP